MGERKKLINSQLGSVKRLFLFHGVSVCSISDVQKYVTEPESLQCSLARREILVAAEPGSAQDWGWASLQCTPGKPQSCRLSQPTEKTWELGPQQKPGRGVLVQQSSENKGCGRPLLSPLASAQLARQMPQEQLWVPRTNFEGDTHSLLKNERACSYRKPAASPQSLLHSSPMSALSSVHLVGSLFVSRQQGWSCLCCCCCLLFFKLT